ncbi:hypothetical protein M8J76_010149 [Diaphorina citri]|nr:hypothetical protein M8J75_002602 [Diaphorina citri]KAI5723729.1 hypothetical protein M8J76_010149 [Diaphorina citri]KAI5727380.1 hypothetical protein M8J77_001540 [Diaphorina citri]
MSQKPAVVILGGCGFVGRNLVEHLVENDLVSKLRVIDKVSPEIAWLNEKQKKIFKRPLVEFISGNLIHPSTCELIFLNSADNSDLTWEYVINCAAETRPGQAEEIYREGIYKLSINCATAAARYGILKYVEISSGEICTSHKHSCKESDEPQPWSTIAKYKCQVEKALLEIPGLNYTIVRPGVVYGKSDRHNLAPRLVMCAIYQYLGETLQLFGGKSLPLNTVHVADLSRAIWHLLSELPPAKVYREIYHVVDMGNTCQEDLMSTLTDIFGVKHDYVGSVTASLCQLDLVGLTEEINDKHLTPWTQLCRKHNIDNTPLTPYIVPDMLNLKPVHLDNAKLRDSGFEFQVPQLSRDKLEEILNDYREMGLFPGEVVTKL